MTPWQMTTILMTLKSKRCLKRKRKGRERVRGGRENEGKTRKGKTF